MVSLIKPDFTIDYMDEVCTEAQKAKVKELIAAGWTASHIFEHPISWLNVWMITKHHTTSASKKPYTHGHVRPDGTFYRFHQSNKITIRKKTE